MGSVCGASDQALLNMGAGAHESKSASSGDSLGR